MLYANLAMLYLGAGRTTFGAKMLYANLVILYRGVGRTTFGA